MNLANSTKIFKAILGRELSVLWLRMILVTIAMVYIGLHKAECNELLLPGLLIGMLMGADLGIRDRNTGFNLTLLTFPLSQSWHRLIRFLIRLLLVSVVAGIFITVFNFKYIHSIPAVIAIFWLFMGFFAATISGLAVRKNIIALSLSAGLLLGWYLLHIGVAWLSSTKSILLSVVLNFSVIPVFLNLCLLIMFAITFLLVFGVFTKHTETRNGITMRQVIFTWLSGAILCVLGLYLLPVYFASKPVEAATKAHIAAAVPDSDSVILMTELDGFPLGSWVVSSDRSKCFTDLNKQIISQVTSDGNYLISTRWMMEESMLEIYELGEEPILKRQIEDRYMYSQMRHILNVSPEPFSQIALIKWFREKPSELHIIDVDNPSADWFWKPDGITKKDNYFPVDWIDSNTLICGINRPESLELWRVVKNGNSELFWSSKATYQTSWNRYLCLPFMRKNTRQSTVVILPGRNQYESIMLEIFDDGRIMEHIPDWLDESYVVLQNLESQSKVFIQLGSSGSLIYDLETGKYTELNVNYLKSLSPDMMHVAYIESEKGKRYLTIEEVNSKAQVKKIPHVKSRIWISNTELVILKSSGQLGRYNIESGNFHLYCDFKWSSELQNGGSDNEQ
ncbi:hypothetical protein K8T06_03230 [bacterium]|nr:hypothetical protein [bacterium]